MKKKIIEKWYKELKFPTEYDGAFYAALERCDLSNIDSVSKYENSEDKAQNLLAFLYFCEELEGKYKEHNIPKEILLDTLSDIVLWTKTYYGLYNIVGLDELAWLIKHLTFRLFKLGRLQFCIAGAEDDIADLGIKKGEPILEVHIPATGPLKIEDCEESFALAKDFFKEYFPSYDYRCFTCHSWLLDRAVLPYLNEGSNIEKFMMLFTPVRNDDSLALARYIFRWDITPDTLEEQIPQTGFAMRIKDALRAKVQFHETFGYIRK